MSAQSPGRVAEEADLLAVREHLLATADDEMIIGHRHAEWTGLGPDLESDIALSSIAQEEIGHARLFYQRLLALGGQRTPARGGQEPPSSDGREDDDVDRLVFDRGPQDYRNAVLLERPNGDWGFTIVRLALYELADAVRLDAWARSSLTEVADLARTLRREEKYHRLYAETWLVRLAGASDESRARIQQTVDQVWPEAQALFEPVRGEQGLLATGALAQAAESQGARWREQVNELFASLKVSVPDISAASGGRGGSHSPDLGSLLDEMTSVWRMDPGARW